MSATPAPSPRALALRLPALHADWAPAGLLALALGWVVIEANGGLRVGDVTTVEIALDLVAGVVAAVAALTAAARRAAAPTVAAVGAFGAFVVLSGVSTIWSVAPDQSWLEANRLVSYLAVFAIGVLLARLAPGRWPALLGGVTLAAVAVSAWALMHKVLPGWLAPDEVYARLREPFGYWNAVGLMAALGVPGCLWVGARREGHPVVAALAYPATGLLVVVLMLSYSRGALLALGIGCAFWFVTVPLRLRGAAVLAAGAIGGGLVIAWTFSQVALSEDRAPLDLREQAGLQLGVAVLFVLLALAVVGLAACFYRDRVALSGRARRRAGIAVLAALALVPAAGVVALATSERGLTGSVSNAFNELTDTSVGGVTNEPGRLTAVGSVRARYWNDALKIFRERPAFGAGIGGYQLARLRVRNDTLDVLNAHGYVAQVLADRGVAGLVVSLAALAALGWAAVVAIRRRGPATAPERVGLLTLATLVVVFGVHSFVDWTWYIPGVALPALLAGGWLAGRAGPPAGRGLALRAGLRSRPRAFLAAAAVVLALSAAWAAAQPQRSLTATNDALGQLAAGRIGTARALADEARARNPLSVDPWFAKAAIERKAGNAAGAERALEAAVKLQPANPSTWTALAEFELNQRKDAAAARRSLSAALYLDPRSVQAIQLLLQAGRAPA